MMKEYQAAAKERVQFALAQECEKAKNSLWRPSCELLLPRRKFLTGAAVGAAALLADRAVANTPFTTFAYPITGGSANRTTPNRFADCINIVEFGADPTGVSDSTTAIQNAINAAYGPPSAPNAISNAYLNKPVFFPAGNYKVTGPIYLVGIYGGYIFGNGSGSTLINFQASSTGNSITGNNATPVFMTDGFGQSIIEGIAFLGNGAAASHTMGLYIFEDSGNFGVVTTQNTFINCNFNGFETGVMGGWNSSGNCDNQTFVNCTFQNCTLYGLRVAGANVLNYGMYGGGASLCGSGSTGAAGNGGAGISISSGTVSPILNPSFSLNTWDVFNSGFNTLEVIGGSSESPGPSIAANGSFVLHATTITMAHASYGNINSGATVYDVTKGALLGTVSSFSGTTLTLNSPGAASASSGSADVLAFNYDSNGDGGSILGNATFASLRGFQYRNLTTLGSKLFANAAGCQSLGQNVLYNPGNSNGGGIIAALGNSGVAIFDEFWLGSGASAAVITGTSGSTLYLRGCNFNGASPTSGFSGTVAQNI